jgi:DNA-binding MarR family transcriptional regulator
MGALSRFEWERLLRELDLPSSVKATGYALATYANTDGTKAHPGLANLCRATGLHHASVVPALAALEAAGLVERKAHGGGRGVGRSAEYELTAGATGILTPEETVRTVRTVLKLKRPGSSKKTSHGAINTSHCAPNTSHSATPQSLDSPYNQAGTPKVDVTDGSLEVPHAAPANGHRSPMTTAETQAEARRQADALWAAGYLDDAVGDVRTAEAKRARQREALAQRMQGGSAA